VSDGEAESVCRRALAAWQGLADAYSEVERSLARGGCGLDVVTARLRDAEAAIAPLLRPLAELRAADAGTIASEARRMLAAIDDSTQALVARNAALVGAAEAARDACASRLVDLSRARTTCAGYATPDEARARFASAVA